MHVTYVRQFVELATTLNFTKAAARLAMSQSNLSRSIASLEREYGVELFKRTSRKVELTPAGQELFAYWNEALHLFDRGIEAARACAKRPVRIFRVENVRTPYSAQSLIDAARGIAEVRKLSFGIETNEEGTRHFSDEMTETLEGLMSGEYDAGTVYRCRLLDESGLEVVPLFREHLTVYLREGQGLSEGEEPPLSALERFVFVGHDYVPTWDEAFRELCLDAGFEPLKVNRFYTSFESAVAALGTGEARAFSGAPIESSAIAELMGLVTVRPQNAWLEVCLAYPQRCAGAEMDEFVALMQDLAAKRTSAF